MDLNRIEQFLKRHRLRLYISSHIKAAEDVWSIGGYDNVIGPEVIGMAVHGNETDKIKAKRIWLEERKHRHRKYFVQISSEDPTNELGVNAYCNSLQWCVDVCFEKLREKYNLNLS